MTNQVMKHKRGRICEMSYLAGIVLMMLIQSAASAEQQVAETPVSSQTEVSVPIWIQDRHTGENVLTYFNEPDQSLWNATRITDYEESLRVKSSPALGIFTIEKLNIRVPIYNGTNEYYLNRGVGRIKGMAKMDEDGNLGLSGHRDGFFRTLKDIQLGDDIEIQTTQGVQSYEVSSITIIPKSDISILEPSTEKMITIVTCYPFYFVGHAPKRYIVKATAKQSAL